MKYFAINGVEIKNPKSFKISRYRITDAVRLASADMSMESKAKKLKFYFGYPAIKSTELDKILDEIWETDSCFFTFSYCDGHKNVNGTDKIETVTCYVGEFPTDLHRGGVGNWVWKNVEFNFIQK